MTSGSTPTRWSPGSTPCAVPRRGRRPPAGRPAGRRAHAGRAGRQPAGAVPRPHRGRAGRRHRQRQVQPVQRARPAGPVAGRACAGRPPASRTPASGGRSTAATGCSTGSACCPGTGSSGRARSTATTSPPCAGWSCSTCPTSTRCSAAHRLEVDRLLGLVDLVVWVVDPQKYADRVVHNSYLREFHRHRDVTVVVLNQADRLPPAELPRVPGRPAPAARRRRARRRAAAGHHRGRPGRAWPGCARRWSGRSPSGRPRCAGSPATWTRWSAELDRAGRPAPAADGPGRPGRPSRQLTGALAGAAGVPAVADGGRAGVPAPGRRGAPAGRWSGAGAGCARTRCAGCTCPGRRRPRRAGGEPGRRDLRARIRRPRSARRVGLAVRAVADRAGADLPAPWPAAVTAAARSRLGRPAGRAGPRGRRHRPGHGPAAASGGGWSAALQWLVTLAALAGLGWLVARLRAARARPAGAGHPTVGEVPLPTVLLLGGLLAGLLVAALIRPVIRLAARRARRRAEQRLRGCGRRGRRGVRARPGPRRC